MNESFEPNWESLRLKDESDERWELRREFLFTHKDKFSMKKLNRLSKTFVNMEFSRYDYPFKDIKKIYELSQEVYKNYNEKRKAKEQNSPEITENASVENQKLFSNEVISAQEESVQREGSTTFESTSRFSETNVDRPSDDFIPLFNNPETMEEQNTQNKLTAINRRKLNSELTAFILFEYASDSQPDVIISRNAKRYSIHLEWEQKRVGNFNVCSILFNKQKMAQGVGLKSRTAKTQASAALLFELKKHFYTIQIIQNPTKSASGDLGLIKGQQSNILDQDSIDSNIMKTEEFFVNFNTLRLEKDSQLSTLDSHNIDSEVLINKESSTHYDCIDLTEDPLENVLSSAADSEVLITKEILPNYIDLESENDPQRKTMTDYKSDSEVVITKDLPTHYDCIDLTEELSENVLSSARIHSEIFITDKILVNCIDLEPENDQTNTLDCKCSLEVIKTAETPTVYDDLKIVKKMPKNNLSSDSIVSKIIKTEESLINSNNLVIGNETSTVCDGLDLIKEAQVTVSTDCNIDLKVLKTLPNSDDLESKKDLVSNISDGCNSVSKVAGTVETPIVNDDLEFNKELQTNVSSSDNVNSKFTKTEESPLNSDDIKCNENSQLNTLESCNIGLEVVKSEDSPVVSDHLEFNKELQTNVYSSDNVNSKFVKTEESPSSSNDIKCNETSQLNTLDRCIIDLDVVQIEETPPICVDLTKELSADHLSSENTISNLSNISKNSISSKNQDWYISADIFKEHKPNFMLLSQKPNEKLEEDTQDIIELTNVQQMSKKLYEFEVDFNTFRKIKKKKKSFKSFQNNNIRLGKRKMEQKFVVQSNVEEPHTKKLPLSNSNTGLKCDVVSSDNIGIKMMKLMGWSGGGLGKNAQGILEPPSVKKRKTRAGIGSCDSFKSIKRNKKSHKVLDNRKLNKVKDRIPSVTSEQYWWVSKNLFEEKTQSNSNKTNSKMFLPARSNTDVGVAHVLKKSNKIPGDVMSEEVLLQIHEKMLEKKRLKINRLKQNTNKQSRLVPNKDICLQTYVLDKENIKSKMLSLLGFSNGASEREIVDNTETSNECQYVTLRDLGLTHKYLCKNFIKKCLSFLQNYLHGNTKTDLIFSNDFLGIEKRNIHHLCKQIGLVSKIYGSKGENIRVSKNLKPGELLNSLLEVGGITKCYRVIEPFNCQ